MSEINSQGSSSRFGGVGTWATATLLFAVGLLIWDDKPDAATTILLIGAAGFVPTWVAAHRRHRNRAAIFVLNLLLFALLMFASRAGLVLFVPALFLGAIMWGSALVWAFTSNVEW